VLFSSLNRVLRQPYRIEPATDDEGHNDHAHKDAMRHSDHLIAPYHFLVRNGDSLSVG
jgi:hypothetical protein